jgi:hypothetical protein
MALTTNPHLMPIKERVELHLCSPCVFMACHRVIFTFFIMFRLSDLLPGRGKIDICGLQNIQTGAGSHPTFYTMSAGPPFTGIKVIGS